MTPRHLMFAAAFTLVALASPAGRALAQDDAGLRRDAAALDRQIGLLEDHVQIERIQRAYGYYVDKAQWPQIAALFSSTGTLEIGGRGVFVGPKRVLEYLVTGLGPIGVHPRQMINHEQLQGVVDVAPDGQTAKGRWTAFVMSAVGGTDTRPAVAGWGDVTYENQYVKENGVWKLSRLRAPFNMYTSYKDGWGKVATPHTRPDSFAPPPDYPPTVVSLTYPSFYVEPYHYPNPVTGKPMPPPNKAAGGVAPMLPEGQP